MAPSATRSTGWSPPILPSASVIISTGRIYGVNRAGLFVTLDETGADGFIPARSIGDEYFRHDESRHAMVGDRSGTVYQIGQKVEVRLVEAAPVAGALRFELIDGTAGSRRRAPQSAKPKPQRTRLRAGARRRRDKSARKG